MKKKTRVLLIVANFIIICVGLGLLQKSRNARIKTAETQSANAKIANAYRKDSILKVQFRAKSDDSTRRVSEAQELAEKNKKKRVVRKKTPSIQNWHAAYGQIGEPIPDSPQ
jgi:flagellar basal body-associated protein FliL